MMHGIHIITSNCMELLASGLAELLRTAPSGADARPLRPQQVMVQSKGMQRWISMTVARHNGICANLEFPFPNAFLEQLYAKLIGPLQEGNPYDPHAMTFRIMQLLPRLLEHPEFEAVRLYLSGPQRPLKKYLLAGKIADMYDQYAVFRPDMLMAWQKNAGIASAPSGFAWQALLWRELAADTQAPHRAVLQKELVQILADRTIPMTMERLPARLAVFGISHLPPFHLQVLEALAQRIPVYLFLLNPCRQFWFDIMSDHQAIRMRASLKNPIDEVGKLYLERGNRLLASLGHLGKQFFDRVYQMQAEVVEEFRDNRSDTLLGRIQQDMLDLIDRPQDEGPPVSPAKADGSLRIHSCHSPMREVEVLYDQLLDMLENQRDLHPRDILVMTPDISLYTPYIHAVFGQGDISRAKIPYTVADQNILRESSVIDSFVKLMALAGGRFEASRVLALLDCPAIHQRFGLSAADLPLAEKWIRSSGIRWGWDSDARKRLKLPKFEENSWRMGLDRLILGYALAGEGDQLFSGILPFDGIGAGEGRLLGRVITFAEAVHECIEKLSGKDSLQGWSLRLHELLERLFQADDETGYEVQALRGVIEKLHQCGRFVAHAEFIPFEVIRQYITESIGRITHDAGFMSGGITFCAMLPMRSIPSKVICLLGMNHDAFPREQHEPGFNLIAVEPRSGDRSKRNDDRYLFLETLISARRTLYLSYVGQNIQDNSVIPPSVLIDEIVEYAGEGLGVPAGQLVIRHPLHAFSPSYFNGEKASLFSYSSENSAAAARLASEEDYPSFFDAPLKEPRNHWRKCEWEQLAAFFAHTARYLLEQRLGVYLREPSQTIEDRESFGLGPLARYQIHQQILHQFIKGATIEHTYSFMCASGVLPHGTVGKVLYQELARDVQDYMRTVASVLPADPPGNASVGIELPPFSLCGVVDDLHADARIVSRMANFRPTDLLKTFVYHLALSISPQTGLPKKSVLICKDAVWSFDEVQNPKAILKDYLDLYWQGLHAPLVFFSKSSFEYAHQLTIKEQDRRIALKAAASKWHGSDFAPGESADPYYRRCFDEKDPLTAEFEELALKVYAPLLTLGRRIATDDIMTDGKA